MYASSGHILIDDICKHFLVTSVPASTNIHKMSYKHSTQKAGHAHRWATPTDVDTIRFDYITKHIINTVEAPINDPLIKGQPLYKGHSHIPNGVLPYEAIIHFQLPKPPYKGQNGWPQYVLYSKVPLYYQLLDPVY